ncbi:metal-dependent hydrolase [Pendulispora albinea]|uniref:Metal-dependent hydrolase n=1 Tax=Pendulispora albinea TaxID=2741071 RepID=A0ABZ2MBV9_9BACT
MHAVASEAGNHPIEVRNLKFDVHADVPRYWVAGRKSVTTFFNNLSIFFPAGERFFIASVRAHQKHVKGAKLHKEVRGFCAQEGIHSREHDRYNEMLERQGYPVAELEQRVERLLARVSKRLPPRMQLAATCALEHFTALMAHALLEESERSKNIFEGADPIMTALWKWHAAEENEHKSVAYDVYLAAGGHYGERVAVMVGASIIFWKKVFEHQAEMMKCDGTVYSVSEWAKLAWGLFGEPGILRKIFPLYLLYYKPSFHPRDLDCSEAIARWKKEFETSAVYHAAA